MLGGKRTLPGGEAGNGAFVFGDAVVLLGEGLLLLLPGVVVGLLSCLQGGGVGVVRALGFEGGKAGGAVLLAGAQGEGLLVKRSGFAGKGFAGGIKRHNFARGPMGHGSKSHREPGSTGAMISGPGGRVLKGKKLPGRMGGERVTVQRLTVVRVDADRNLILIKGAIPGPKKGFVVIKDTVKPAKAAKE